MQYQAVGLAWMISFGNCANIISSNVFITKQAPRYPVGFTTGLIFTVFGFCLVSVGTISLILLNKAREKKVGPMIGDEQIVDGQLSFKFHI